MIQNKTIRWALFIFMAIAQLAVPIWMIYSKEKVRVEGKIYNFELQAIDPTDPFRGKYIILNPKANKYNWHKELNQSEMYASFENDSLGYAQIKDLQSLIPNESDYLRVRVEGRTSKEDTFPLTISYPFVRYYMNEYKAKAAEDLSRTVFRDSMRTCYAEVAIYKGKANLLSVKVDGVPIEEILNQDPH